ncbi:MAG: cytochrome c biogenesis protein CcsA [Bradymonadales bacterium]|nr:cytochrome c biogenesis protein CcsA [Bradymonadales bacterium]
MGSRAEGERAAVGGEGGRASSRAFLLLVGGAGLALVVAVVVIFHCTPQDAELGFVQKIFYFHLPSALYGYLGFTICCVASIGYLVRPRVIWDVVAQSGAFCGVLFCGMVLLSGPLWARKSWEPWWTGEPRLVLTLVLFLLFVSYLLVRSFGGRGELTRQIGAVLAVFGFADIPLVHLAVKRWGGHHPRVIHQGGISGEMWLALGVSMVALGLLFVVLFWLRLRVGLLEEEVEDLHRDIADRSGLVEDRQ